MNWGQSLPPRQPGQLLTVMDLSYNVYEQDGREILKYSFRGRDNRIWQATIELRQPGTDDNYNQYDLDDFEFLLVFQSAGCRSMAFLVESEQAVRELVLRFANIGIDNYRRLIADAQGTLDYPKSNDLGVFRMMVTHVNQVGIRIPGNDYEVNGIGRLCNGELTIFPQAAELRAILDTLCNDNAVALVPDGINTLDQEEQYNYTNRYRGVSLANLTSDQFNDIINRNFAATNADVLKNLKDGVYKQWRRPGRFLDLGDHEQTSGEK